MKDLNKTITISKDEFIQAVAKECVAADDLVLGMMIAMFGAKLTARLFDGEDEEGTEQC